MCRGTLTIPLSLQGWREARSPFYRNRLPRMPCCKLYGTCLTVQSTLQREVLNLCGVSRRHSAQSAQHPLNFGRLFHVSHSRSPIVIGHIPVSASCGISEQGPVG